MSAECVYCGKESDFSICDDCRRRLETMPNLRDYDAGLRDAKSQALYLEMSNARAKAKYEEEQRLASKYDDDKPPSRAVIIMWVLVFLFVIGKGLFWWYYA